ncbi:Clp protease N-terminal domain-containing protein [Actinoallomurus purpureus]|uniref:Clp protease N-terminal domain-containing protein n=1 Tax=Actinoallomurus purpureus TaxID=478114 RepID=UPI003557EC45
MLERFTDTARRVVVHAQEEARALRHGHIGTEHLLLGLLRGDAGGAARALDAAGITLDAARRDVEELVGRGSRAPDGDMPFTPRAKKVLELSLREALQLGDDYIRSEHILLGLMREPEGVGVRVLQRRGVDTLELRRGVIMALRGPQPTEGPEPQAAGSPEQQAAEGPGQQAAEGLGQEAVAGPERQAEARPWPQAMDLPWTSPGEAAIEERLTAIEHRLERIERLLRDGWGPGSA